jgi:hypothetical protein
MDAVNGNPIARDIRGRKKGESLNMIPVSVTDEEMYADWTRSELARQLGAKNTYA